MATWLCERVSDVRARLRPDDEGSLWLLFLDHVQGEVILATAFDGIVDPSNFQMTRGLRRIISEVPSPAVLLVVPRADAQPLAADRDLWNGLSASPPAGTELVDLVIVGDSSFWSASSARSTDPQTDPERRGVQAGPCPPGGAISRVLRSPWS
jgi:hypothetical protein